jgi:hypothetical protein
MLTSELKSDTRVSALLEEQARLTEQLKEMATRLHRIQKLAQVSQSITVNKASPNGESDGGDSPRSSGECPDSMEQAFETIISGITDTLPTPKSNHDTGVCAAQTEQGDGIFNHASVRSIRHCPEHYSMY